MFDLFSVTVDELAEYCVVEASRSRRFLEVEG